MRSVRRVALFSPEYPPFVLGGLGTHVDALSKELSKTAAVDVFVPERGVVRDARDAHNITVHAIADDEADESPEGWIHWCQSAARAAAQVSPRADIIHAHDWPVGLAALMTRRLIDRPVVFSVHLPQWAGVQSLMENIAIAAADLIVVNSQAVAGELKARELPIRRMDIVPNGVDLHTFHPPTDWPRDDGYVLFVGRLVPQKGVDALLRAFAIVLRRHPDARLVIVGDGLQDLYLRRVARFMGIADRVAFVGWASGEPLVALYQHAQMLVVPSRYEPFGIVALEAMACARPLVASRLGGLTEIVEHGVSGLLFEPDNYLEMAKHVATLISDADTRRDMGTAARRRAERFSWDDAARRFEALYGSVDLDAMEPWRADVIHDMAGRLVDSIGGHVSDVVSDLLASSEV